MLNQQTTDQLRALKLTGMLEAWEQQREQPQTHDLSFDERLALLVEREVLHRENRRLARLLKAAKLRVNACVEDIDYRHPRGLEKARMAALASGDWILQAHNLCITGPTGCGKTWLACALGNQACRQGLSVRYLRLPTLFEQLRIAHGDGSWPRLMNRLLKMDLLIIDDWGLQKITAAQRQDLMEVIEDRHGRRSPLTVGPDQASLRSRERFWDIRVPKIDSIFDNSLVPRPSWSPGVPPQHRKLVAATHRSPI